MTIGPWTVQLISFSRRQRCDMLHSLRMMVKFSDAEARVMPWEGHPEIQPLAHDSRGISDAFIPQQSMEVIKTAGPAVTIFLFLMNSVTIQSDGGGKP